MTYCLGLEGTAHTFGASVVHTDGTILSNCRDIYTPEKGGIHPRDAMFHHTNLAHTIIHQALDEASLSYSDIDIMAFSRGPGLGPCLRTTATAARAIALAQSIPLVGVNHCVAHVEIGKLTTSTKDPLTIYLSGGNSLITAAAGGRYRVFGETLDLAIGNLLDTFGRNAGLQHPGGPKIEKLASESHETFIDLPYTVKGMDLSFSGLLTSATNRLSELGSDALPDLCYSLQEVSFAMISEVAERAIAHTKKKEMLLTGGVAQNKRLQIMLKQVAQDHDVTFYVVPAKYAGDNAAMIAWTGMLLYQESEILPVPDSTVLPKWRIDEAATPWLPQEKQSQSERI
jgi:N6-L-threonylcarbamoyladenine synthase/protein kinase Bud32